MRFILPGFGGPKVATPPPPPPPPTTEDPSIAKRKTQVRQSEAARRGRAASILTPLDESTLGATPVNQPGTKTTARLLGG